MRNRPSPQGSAGETRPVETERGDSRGPHQRANTRSPTTTSATIATSTPAVIATAPTPTRRVRRSRRRARGRRRPAARRSSHGHPRLDRPVGGQDRQLVTRPGFLARCRLGAALESVPRDRAVTGAVRTGFHHFPLVAVGNDAVAFAHG